MNDTEGRQVCNAAIRNKLVIPFDTIDYTFCKSRMNEIERGYIKTQNSVERHIFPTVKTTIINYGVTVPEMSNLRIRKLTPKECWRLMGFDDIDIDKCIEAGISNTQLYKQAGNSIVVPVLEKILGNLLEID